MNIGIHGKKFGEETKEVIINVLSKLHRVNSKETLSEEFKSYMLEADVQTTLEIYTKGDDLSYLDALITLGGDGTLLEAITHIADKEVPILGINTGRLGFLATTAKEHIEYSIEQLVRRNYSFDERSLLSLQTNNNLFKGYNFALNDFAILKKATTSMIVVHDYVDGEFLNSYWADGVIVSTPTGSTGYSISCGGPVVLPHSENFIITPISPHNLTVRPIIVPDNSKLSFSIEGRTNSFLVALDSRLATVDDAIELKVCKADFRLKLIQLPGNNYFKTLRQKLNWGLDVRN